MELPRLFINCKNEFTRATKAYWSTHTKTDIEYEDTANYKTKKIEKKSIDKESFAEYWLILQDIIKFMEKEESYFSEKLKSVFDDNGKNYILLPKHNKKIVYDDEAKWFVIEDMTTKDWKENSKLENKKYLEK